MKFVLNVGSSVGGALSAQPTEGVNTSEKIKVKKCFAPQNIKNKELSLQTVPFSYLTFFIDLVKFKRLIISIGKAMQKIRPNFSGSIVIDGFA